MRILYVSDSYYPHINGVYYFVCRVGPLLQDKGHEIAVIAPSESMSSSLKKVDRLDVYGLPSMSVVFYPSVRVPVPFGLKKKIRKIITDFKPDIIHIQDHFPICKAVVSVNRKLKIPIMGTNHFMPENITVFLRRQYWKKRLENFLWKGFSKVFNQVRLVTTPTEYGVSLIRPRLNVDTMAISSGIDLSAFNPIGDTQSIRVKYGLPDKHILIYVGRLDPEKHIEEILEAVAVAVKTIDFCFVIVGKGTSKPALEQRAQKLGITESVFFTGFVPDADLPIIYRASRCFIIASIAELLSLTTLQAMASGLPVIAVNAGALPELVKDGMNGYLYNEGDIPAMVKRIGEIITRDDLYQSMRSKTLELIQRHNIHTIVDTFEKIYLEKSL